MSKNPKRSLGRSDTRGLPNDVARLTGTDKGAKNVKGYMETHAGGCEASAVCIWSASMPDPQSSEYLTVTRHIPRSKTHRDTTGVFFVLPSSANTKCWTGIGGPQIGSAICAASPSSQWSFQQRRWSPPWSRCRCSTTTCNPSKRTWWPKRTSAGFELFFFS